MVNSEILINYYSVYNDTPKEVEKEVALNLLERMLTIDLLIITRYPTSIVITSKKCAEIKMKPLHWRRPEIIKLRH